MIPELLLNQVYLLFDVRQVFCWGAGEGWKVDNLPEITIDFGGVHIQCLDLINQLSHFDIVYVVTTMY